MSIRRLRHPYRDWWIMLHQDKSQAIAQDRSLDGTDLRVYLYLVGLLDYENYIPMTQTQVAEQLRLRYQHLNRSVRKLVDREVLEEGPSIGRIRSYRLNPEYGYKGKVTNLQKTLQNRKLTVIKGGA